MAFANEHERNRTFTDVIVNPDAALPSAIEFINDHMAPDEVFDDEKLAEWAKVRGWTPPPQSGPAT